MKNIAITLFLSLAAALPLTAQDLETDGNDGARVFDFEENIAEWNEYAEKKTSAAIGGGCLLLESKKEDTYAESAAPFPLRVDEDFTVTFRMSVPKIDDKHCVGVLFDYEDEENYRRFVFDRNHYYYYVRRNGGKPRKVKQGSLKNRVKFPTRAKNPVTTVTLRRKGDKLEFYINNMDVFVLRELNKNDLAHASLGFYTDGKSRLQALSVALLQEGDGDSDD